MNIRIYHEKEYENITKIEYEYHNNNQTAGSRNSTNVPSTDVQGTLLYSLTPWRWRQVEVGWPGFLLVSRRGVGWRVGMAGGPEQAGREPSTRGVNYQLGGSTTNLTLFKHAFIMQV